MASQIETLILTSEDSVAIISTPASVPRNVHTELSYYTPPADGSPQLPIYITDGKTRVKTVQVFHPVTIHDVRGSGEEHTLDLSGIQFVEHRSALQGEDFDDEERIKGGYYGEIEDILRSLTGASKVKIFHHVVRKAHTHFLYLDDDAAKDEGGAKDETVEGEGSLKKAAIPAELQGPVRGAHIDQSYDYAPEVVKAHFPAEEAERLLKGRFQIINIWRPIKTIFKDPFAVLDARTVLEEELVNVRVIYPTYEFESVNVRRESEERMGKESEEGHKWWYMSQQTPEDVLCFKIFDSKTDGRARRVPHSAFTDPEYEDRDARMSVEVRALVFHEDDIE